MKQKKIEELTDKELMRKLNLAISDWSIAYTGAEFKQEIVKEYRAEQVKRLLDQWKMERDK